jgi:hypothetical protein
MVIVTSNKTPENTKEILKHVIAGLKKFKKGLGLG